MLMWLCYVCAGPTHEAIHLWLLFENSPLTPETFQCLFSKLSRFVVILFDGYRQFSPEFSSAPLLLSAWGFPPRAVTTGHISAISLAHNDVSLWSSLYPVWWRRNFLSTVAMTTVSAYEMPCDLRDAWIYIGVERRSRYLLTCNSVWEILWYLESVLFLFSL